ncbi:uncharacterized protein LOC124942313 isoform X2 [Impatiens glandulifera]|uniref:uncharacterized protein LOC124942313 isoform X2 n=1 Tax=Impatiens glandulifera TaxID=253017 RepID=UPI001FB18346|nr:uncharacterized protein LOC124942313 isoform X2 [Impatiens glandulifera]
MGKLNHPPFITHFSHPHPLELCNLDLPNNQTHYLPPSSSCSACSLPLSSGYIYICKTCPNFSLHLSCSQLPPSITHPSHPYHPLFLTPTSTYPGGQFSCDACKIHSAGFSYHCSSCSFDLHIKCVIRPLIKNHHLHPHPLDLTFAPPYGDGSGFSCDVCRHVGTSHWLYRCKDCEFDVHLDCPSSVPGRQSTPAPLIHQQSLPAPPLKHQQSMPAPLTHQQSLPAMGVAGGQPPMQQNYYPQPQFQQQQQQQQVNQAPIMQQSASLGVMQNQRPPVQSWQAQAQAPGQAMGPAANQSMGDMVMQAAVQGFVEGAAQQVAQTMVQDFILNDGGAGAGDNNNGGDQVDCENY